MAPTQDQNSVKEHHLESVTQTQKGDVDRFPAVPKKVSSV